jgi:hypothetical protein
MHDLNSSMYSQFLSSFIGTFTATVAAKLRDFASGAGALYVDDGRYAQRAWLQIGY